MIVGIKVKRKRFGVTYIPRHQVSRLPKETHVISIEYFDEYRPDLSEFASALELTVRVDRGMGFYLEQILDYVKTCNGDNIVVHCEMGLVRSKWVAERIAASGLGYSLGIDFYTTT